MYYWLIPLVAWFLTGIVKFSINTIKYKELAWKYIGYGGMPSNHSAIVGSIFFYIGLKDGFNTPMAGIAATMLFIVVMDALSLRKNIGKQASVLNKLTFETGGRGQAVKRIYWAQATGGGGGVALRLCLRRGVLLAIRLMVLPPGLEPRFSASEANVLSIELREQAV